jgi:hypothetical protein
MLAQRERARLVEDHRIQIARFLQAAPVTHEQTVARAPES